MSVAVHRSSAPVGLLALWVLTGLAGVVTVMGLLTVGIFVLPVALALLALAIVRTVRRADGWPAMAGLGVALAVGVAWLGVVLATSGPAELSCSGSSDGATTCTSQGRVVDSDAFEWARAAPWFAVACVVALLSVVAFVAARRLVTASERRREPDPVH